MTTEALSTDSSASTTTETSTGTESTASAETTNVDAGNSTPDFSNHKFKIKADKIEKELSYEDTIRYAQKGFASDKRFEDVAAKEKQLTQFYSALKTDFAGTVKALAKQTGHSIDEISLALMDGFVDETEERVKRGKMTPEQIELEDLRKEKAERERLSKEHEEKEHKTKAEREYAETKTRHFESFKNQIGEALDKVNFLKGDTPQHALFYDHAVGDAAEKIQYCIQNKIPYDMHDIVEHVNESFKSRINLILSIADDKVFEGYIPEDFMKRVGKHYAKKLGGPQSASAPKPSAAPKKDDKPQVIHVTEYMKRLGL